MKTRLNCHSRLPRAALMPRCATNPGQSATRRMTCHSASASNPGRPATLEAIAAGQSHNQQVIHSVRKSGPTATTAKAETPAEPPLWQIVRFPPHARVTRTREALNRQMRHICHNLPLGTPR